MKCDFSYVCILFFCNRQMSSENVLPSVSEGVVSPSSDTSNETENVK